MNLLHEKLRSRGHHCPCMGGGGGSSSSATTTNNVDKRVVVDSGIGVSGDNNSVSILDGGAIEKSFDFAKSAGSASFEFAKSAQGAALASLDTTAKVVKDAYEDAKGRGSMTDKILIGSVAMAGVVALMAIKKRG